MPNTPSLSTSDHTPRIAGTVKVLGWASFWNDVASEMVYPLLPQFLIAVLGGNRFTLGIIEGTADSLSGLLKLWSGGRSDRLGRRKVFVLGGYALATVVRPLTGVLAAPWQLFFARIIDRTGKGIRTAPRDAMIADVSSVAVRGRAFGFQRGMDHLGAAVGPIVASAFLWFLPGQLRWLFLLTIIPGLIVMVVLIAGLREKGACWPPHDQQGADAGERAPGRIRDGYPLFRSFGVLDSRFRIYLLSLIVFTLGNSSDAFLLVRAGELGVAVWLLPGLWCMFHLLKSGGSMLAGRYVDRWGPRPMILGGWLLYAVVYLAFALASSAWHAWVLFGAYALFHALTEPAEKTLVANLAGSRHRGLGYGWFHLSVSVAALPSSLVFGWFYEQCGSLLAFGWGAGLALVAALILTVPGNINGRPGAGNERNVA